MSNIMNVEEIRSVSRFGLSVVTVVFKESVPILDARQLINEQIQTVAGEIPPELGTPEMMHHHGTGRDLPIHARRCLGLRRAV